MLKLAVLVASAIIAARPLVSPDVLEPSVLNELDHALSLAPTNAPACAVANPFATNGLDATAVAVKVISAQRADGRWYCGTNDVTAEAAAILGHLREERQE